MRKVVVSFLRHGGSSCARSCDASASRLTEGRALVFLRCSLVSLGRGPLVSIVSGKSAFEAAELRSFLGFEH